MTSTTRYVCPIGGWCERHGCTTHGWADRDHARFHILHAHASAAEPVAIATEESTLEAHICDLVAIITNGTVNGAFAERDWSEAPAPAKNNHDHYVGKARAAAERLIYLLDRDVAANEGRAIGRGAASWVVDGNTTEETKANIRRMIEEGDPVLYNTMPSPLSGEWGGESLAQLSLHVGVDLDEDDFAVAFMDGYSEGWERGVEEAVALTPAERIAEHTGHDEYLREQS